MERTCECPRCNTINTVSAWNKETKVQFVLTMELTDVNKGAAYYACPTCKRQVDGDYLDIK